MASGACSMSAWKKSGTTGATGESVAIRPGGEKSPLQPGVHRDTRFHKLGHRTAGLRPGGDFIELRGVGAGNPCRDIEVARSNLEAPAGLVDRHCRVRLDSCRFHAGLAE